MEVVTDVLSWLLLLAGAFFLLTSAIGVLRLPDVFTRLHAAGMTDTLGAALTLTGLMLQAGFSLVTVKLLLIWLFLWFTSPVSTHAVARAALLAGIEPILHRGVQRTEEPGEAAPVGAETEPRPERRRASSP